MIEIVKSGKTKFETTCSRCGCTFTYELEDLRGTRYVNCPECKADCFHPDQNLGNIRTTLYESYKNSIGSETCVICGNPVPEGRQICSNCEKGAEVIIDEF